MDAVYPDAEVGGVHLETGPASPAVVLTEECKAEMAPVGCSKMFAPGCRGAWSDGPEGARDQEQRHDRRRAQQAGSAVLPTGTP